MQLEAQFVLAGITVDATKFHYALSGLDTNAMREVRDVLRSPPTGMAYEKLKAELIRRLSTSDEAKIRQLLAREELGDRMPSQFLRHLGSLAGTTVPDNLLRAIWTDRLTRTLQAILAGQTDQPLEKIADLADRVHEATGNQVASVSPLSEIAEFTRVVSELVTQFRRERSREGSVPRNRARRRSRSRNHRKSRDASADSSNECWYHRIFRDKANRCRSPCARKSGNDTHRQ